MLHLPSFATLVVFFSISFITFFSTYWLESTSTQSELNLKEELKRSESHFETVEYFLFQNNEPVLLLNADKLDMLGDGNSLSFEVPHGKAFSQKSDTPIYFSSSRADVSDESELIELNDNVQLSYEGAEFQAKVLRFWPNKNYFSAWGNIRSQTTNAENGDKLEITSHEVQGWPSQKESLYKGEVQGKLVKKRVYQEGFEFSSQVLRAKLAESLITMNGEVSLNKQRFRASSQSAEVYLGNYNKKLKYYVLYDDIRIEEQLKLRDGTSLVREAFSEVLEGFQAEGKIVLSGAPRVIQGSDVIKGYRIILRENVELVEVDDANSIFTLKKE